MKEWENITINERKGKYNNEWKEGRENIRMNERKKEYENEWTNVYFLNVDW